MSTRPEDGIPELFEEYCRGRFGRKKMKLVVIESPYAGDIKRNMNYLRACFSDCLKRGEAPIASHKLYTDVEDCFDEFPERRELGINAGFAWGALAHKIVIYTDLGVSSGMRKAIEHYERIGKVIEYRSIATVVPRNW